MDQILRLTNVQPNCTVPFTSALSRYVVRDYLMAKAFPVQGETRTCSPHCAAEMTYYFLISICTLTHCCCTTGIPPALMASLSIFVFSPFPSTQFCTVQAWLALALTQTMRNCSSRRCRNPDNAPEVSPVSVQD